MTNITLNPCQSLALRQAIDALKANDKLYDECPEIVRKCLCDILMPPYSTAEEEILALRKQVKDLIKLCEKIYHESKK